MSANDASLFQDSHALMVRLLLSQQQADLADGLPLSNRIDPKRLCPVDRDRLKQAFKSISYADTVAITRIRWRDVD